MASELSRFIEDELRNKGYAYDEDDAEADNPHQTLIGALRVEARVKEQETQKKLFNIKRVVCIGGGVALVLIAWALLITGSSQNRVDPEYKDALVKYQRSTGYDATSDDVPDTSTAAAVDQQTVDSSKPAEAAAAAAAKPPDDGKQEAAEPGNGTPSIQVEVDEIAEEKVEQQQQQQQQEEEKEDTTEAAAGKQAATHSQQTASSSTDSNALVPMSAAANATKDVAISNSSGLAPAAADNSTALPAAAAPNAAPKTDNAAAAAAAEKDTALDDDYTEELKGEPEYELVANEDLEKLAQELEADQGRDRKRRSARRLLQTNTLTRRVSDRTGDWATAGSEQWEQQLLWRQLSTPQR